MVRGEVQTAGGQVLLQVGDGRRARNGEHDGRTGQQPGEDDLGGGRGQLGSHRLDLAVLVRERPPGQERDAQAGARLQDRFVGAVDDVVAVLDGGYPGDRAGLLQLVDRDLGQADPGCLARGDQLGQSAYLVGERHRRVDAVQLQQLDPLQPQPFQAAVHLAAQ